MRRSSDEMPLAPPPHHNSQHVLAIVDGNGRAREELRRDALAAFGKTSELPADVWRSEDGSVLLASNYPDCILENEHWCVLCAGFAYRYREAFGGASSVPNGGSNGANIAAENDDSFARTLLNFCEGHRRTDGDLSFLDECTGRRLKRCSGHFSAYVVRKGSGASDPPQLWAWNDPFGFMPVYYSRREKSCVISSHWDCLVPLLPSLRLDWDIVAEYITLGTTLGGGGNDCETFNRTFVRGIVNLGPGCFIRSVPFCEVLELAPTRYIECYGACEETTDREELRSKWKIESSSKVNGLSRAPLRKLARIRGVQVVDTKEAPPSESSLDGDACGLLFHFIMDCVREAQAYATRAALTGGGDTRLILACMALIKQEQLKERTEKEVISSDDRRIIFQTHSKQPTDWLIARHLAKHFRLEHQRIHPVSTTTNGGLALWNKNEVLLSNLHDQTPLRRKQNPGFLFWRNEECTTEEVEYTLHGRFGTEFLGCLCYNKSPLDVRAEELEEFLPKATALFEAVFGASSYGGDAIRNPVDALHDRFQKLERDRMAYGDAIRKHGPEQSTNNNSHTLDVAYAFQLQLYTRSTLSDIYKGLRGGSWFSIPAAQFTRNAITPFLDNRLLQWMMCNVSVGDKNEPYRLYGQLYQSGAVPEYLLGVPSNNKLLCIHSEIPHAQKRPEAKARPHIPSFVSESNEEMSHSSSRTAQETLQQKFDPVFWEGAIAIFKSAPIVMDPKSVVIDPRPQVQALLDRLGGDAEAACRLSGRLQSFLLWYERRFLVHEHKL